MRTSCPMHTNLLPRNLQRRHQQQAIDALILFALLHSFAAQEDKERQKKQGDGRGVEGGRYTNRYPTNGVALEKPTEKTRKIMIGTHCTSERKNVEKNGFVGCASEMRRQEMYWLYADTYTGCCCTLTIDARQSRTCHVSGLTT